MQAFAFCAGAVGMAPLIGGAFAEAGVLDEGVRAHLLSDVLTDAAVDQRVELVLAALHATPVATPSGEA
jgi:hypothetical protein